ncbi:MAG: hypothetical protein AAGF33_03755 [Pseudomonadota bacterium]
MILRRITQHVKAQNWTAVGLDFVIVVVGVFIGIQLGNWNQDRLDRAEEAAFLRTLQRDVLELERITDRLIDLRVAQLSDIASVAAVLQGRDPWRELTNDECGSIAGSHIVGILPTDLPSWTALNQSGRTGILRDNDLRSGLAELSQRREALNVITSSVQAINYDLPRMYPELFKITTAPLDPDEAAGRAYYDADYICDFDAFAQSQAALNALSFNLDGFSAAVNLHGIKPYGEQVGKIRQILNERLGVADEASIQ